MSTPTQAPKKRIRAKDREYTYNDFESWKAAVKMLHNKEVDFVDDGDLISFAFTGSNQEALPGDQEEVRDNKVGFFNKQQNWGYVDEVPT